VNSVTETEPSMGDQIADALREALDADGYLERCAREYAHAWRHGSPAELSRATRRLRAAGAMVAAVPQALAAIRAGGASSDGPHFPH